ncbi:hypothetical protein AJ87_04155 [Rhizobium yanglingense]|nr:hypothetical protein AJ87_04155 [Rhizobium yanglingense]
MTSFLTVQEGCDKFCTFCVVPYTRGSEISRPVSQIVEEAQKLVEGGVREITLLGQNVNAWHGAGANGEEWSLGDLLYRLAEIPGLARLRYTTSHPRDMDDRLIEAHRDLRALMPYLHLPVQAGSDRILKAMNRRHTAAEYMTLIGVSAQPVPILRFRAISSLVFLGRQTRILKLHCVWWRRLAMRRLSPSNIRRGRVRPGRN